MMEPGRFFFDPSPSSVCQQGGGNMLFLGNADHLFRGTGSVMGLMDQESSRRRPFFSSSSLQDELYDEEYYDEQLPEKKRRLTPEQVHMLEKSFETENKLEPERKTQLAKKLGLQQRQVAVWFQNRRARWKTKQLERDYDLLKSSYDSLLSNYDSILEENQKLRSQVVSINEKLGGKEEASNVITKASDDCNDEIRDIFFPSDGDEMKDVVLTNIPYGGCSVKVEDRLSSGSGVSAVVDEAEGPQVVDSGNSYNFPNEDNNNNNNNNVHSSYPHHHSGVNSEEDDGSDDGGQGYLSDVFAAAVEQQVQQEEGVSLGWWVWS